MKRRKDLPPHQPVPFASLDFIPHSIYTDNKVKIEIYYTSGILQYRAISDGNDVISLPAGIYIVKVDGKTYKLAI